MSLLQILRAVSLGLAALISLCYAYQVIYLFLPFFQKPKPHSREKLHRYAVLIAARNEEAVLPYLLQSIRSQDYPPSLITVYVVADNCTDGTARVAADGGAIVFQRFDHNKIGKGYALQYLLEQIDISQHDAFLIFDADNLLCSDYISQLNRTCSDGYAVFCGYRNSKNFATNWVSAGHSVWYLHDSVHLNQSRHLAELPCAVTGTGYGFTRELLERLGGWNFCTLTEDIELSVWCATHGIRAGYCHDAILYDEQPERFSQSFRQRRRWVQGTIQVSVRYGWDLLRGFGKGGRTGLACLEAVTLSLWGHLTCALCAVLGFVTTLLSAGLLAALQALLLALVMTYVSMLLPAALVLFTERQRIRATAGQRILALVSFPVYILSFLPIFLAALFSKFSWPPIDHTLAISAEEMQNTNDRR